MNNLKSFFGFGHVFTFLKTVCLIVTLCHISLWMFGCCGESSGETSRGKARHKTILSNTGIPSTVSLSMLVLFISTISVNATSNLLEKQNNAWINLNQLYSTWEWKSDFVMTEFQSNSRKQKYQDGTINWNLSNNNRTRKSNFLYLPKLLSKSESKKLKSLLPSEFDQDIDSVDESPTYEFYLEKNGNYDDG
jgi:hypothetical protein